MLDTAKFNDLDFFRVAKIDLCDIIHICDIIFILAFLRPLVYAINTHICDVYADVRVISSISSKLEILFTRCKCECVY